MSRCLTINALLCVGVLTTASKAVPICPCVVMKNSDLGSVKSKITHKNTLTTFVLKRILYVLK